MATQAAYHGGYGTADSGAAASQGIRGVRGAQFRLRAFPNEDVYFHRKHIDNSRVVREADPQARARCWKTIGTAALATLLMGVLFWPKVYGVAAGYQIESLKQEQQKLLAERARLDVYEAGLLSPERLQDVARAQRFIDPAPDQVVSLNPKADGSLAMNLHAKP